MAAVESPPTGLRDRQKSRRRRDILEAARNLFETRGYNATTMAKIAEAAEVSTPTVFNYFGTKDELIVEMVLEGHEAGREFMSRWQPRPGQDLGDLLGEIMCKYAELTMGIAGKRVWRFAEATNIRNPESPVMRLYGQIEPNHVDEITGFLTEFTRCADAETERTCRFLAGVVYDCWNAEFYDFISNEAVTLDSHLATVREKMKNLAALLTIGFEKETRT